MKILLCIVCAVIFLFLILQLYLAVKYSSTKPSLRLFGWVYTLFSRFDSVEGLCKYAGGSDRLLSRPIKNQSKTVEKQVIPITGRGGNTISLAVYRPKNAEPEARGLLWLHGGAFAYGSPVRDERFFIPLVMETNTVAVVPDYRLSVEAPYPAAFHDCCDSLLWMNEHAKELGINSSQLFVGGCSAGSCLSAALTLFARNTRKVSIAFQILIYSALDDRMNTPSMTGNNSLIWNEKQNTAAWQLYLKDLYGTDQVPVYAAPAREKDLSGLPPAYSFVGSLDPLRDETVYYINALKAAGVEARCDVYEGAYHGFDAVPSKISRQARAKLLAEYKYAAEHYFAGQEGECQITPFA